jgi:hypothetical protein
LPNLVTLPIPLSVSVSPGPSLPSHCIPEADTPGLLLKMTQRFNQVDADASEHLKYVLSDGSDVRYIPGLLEL